MDTARADRRVPKLPRNLVLAVVALSGVSLLAIVLFDTPWWGILIGFSLAVVWIVVFSAAIAGGVPLVPRTLRGGAGSVENTRTKYLVPIWVVLVAIWFAAGWFITNGGG